MDPGLSRWGKVGKNSHQLLLRLSSCQHLLALDSSHQDSFCASIWIQRWEDTTAYKLFYLSIYLWTPTACFLPPWPVLHMQSGGIAYNRKDGREEVVPKNNSTACWFLRWTELVGVLKRAIHYFPAEVDYSSAGAVWHLPYAFHYWNWPGN